MHDPTKPTAVVPALVAPAAAVTQRLVAMDWMRGLVMVLMTIDHASDAFNAERAFGDSALFYKPGTIIPAAQFFTRWITHLCAPTFVFLAGAALALSVARRRAAGRTSGQIDRHIITRGLFIAALDPLWMSLGFMGWQRVLLQVLYALGISLVCMAALRRLPPLLLATLGVATIVGVDALVGHMRELPSPGTPPLLVGLLVSGGRYGFLIVGYPVASWLGIMMLGWAFGDWQARHRSTRPEGFLALGGIALLGVFAWLRGVDGFGNMALHRDDNTLIQWLHVSKYPPSVTYCALELGIMALFLAFFFYLSRAARHPSAWNPLLVLGQNAMFYYLLHLHLLMAASYILGVHAKLGLGAAYAATAVTVVVLYFACRRYGRYKAANDNLITRYI